MITLVNTSECLVRQATRHRTSNSPYPSSSSWRSSEPRVIPACAASPHRQSETHVVTCRAGGVTAGVRPLPQPQHIQCFLDPRQLGGVPGIEHPPHSFSSQPSSRANCKLVIPTFSHRQINGGFRSHRRRYGNQPFAPRRSGHLRDPRPWAILPAIASSRQSAACQSTSPSQFPCGIASGTSPIIDRDG